MSMSDPIADMLTRIRNAAKARFNSVDIPGVDEYALAAKPIDIFLRKWQQLVERVRDIENMEQAWRKALYVLAEQITVFESDVLEQGGVVALVGATHERASVLDAIRARRVYGTSGERIVLGFRLEAHPMGSAVARGEPVSAEVIARLPGTPRAACPLARFEPLPRELSG